MCNNLKLKIVFKYVYFWFWQAYYHYYTRNNIEYITVYCSNAAKWIGDWTYYNETECKFVHSTAAMKEKWKFNEQYFFEISIYFT